MPVLHMPSPHAAERDRAARRMQRLGLFLIVFAGVKAVFTAALYISIARLSSALPEIAFNAAMDSVILANLREVAMSLFIGIVGAGAMVAARAIRCGKRWAYAAAFLPSALTAVWGIRVLSSFLSLIVEFDRFIQPLMQYRGTILFWMTALPTIHLGTSIIFCVLGLFPAVLAIYALVRLYWTEYSAARRNRV